ncbi:ABC transporter substrate-binding protein [Nonomuraea zeae]|uniref:ABC transporter substrate-binding protein n=1 Tax=Nonomuraea zeae TaxID=1642303 RepID=A0A5S4FYH6_9ACTN|nr:ABC transporter substrate-binding protein [Nonomuraea zeae]
MSGCALKEQTPAPTAGKTITIGYVSPQTGGLAVFGESNDDVLGAVRKALAGGVRIGGTSYEVKIVTKDSQSSATRAAQVASELIQNDRADLILATSTPDTTNPVSDQCEAAGVPCVATICPWEIWTAGGAAKNYSFLHFIGTEQEVGVFSGLWKRVPGGEHVVAGLWPNDTDGDLYRKFVTARTGELGWKLVDSGAYEDGTQDYSAILGKFEDADILQATPIPPDWVTFWRQARQSRYAPKLACVAKAMLFSSVADGLGDLARNLVAGVWWAPGFPYRSSLDGTTAKAFADGYRAGTGRQWTPPMGFNHALFEIAVAALKSAADPKDRAAVRAALAALKGEAISGRYDFTKGPSKNVSLAPDLAGQWRKGADGKFDLTIVDNSLDPAIPLQGDLELL